MPSSPRSSQLRRTIGLPSLVLYGLGTIIGAGIYVLVGEVADVAGKLSPFAFGVAGVLAVISGFSYAELSARYPEAGGAAVYLREAFKSDLAGKTVGLAIAVIAATVAASICRGGVSYLLPLVPLPADLLSIAVVLIFVAIACLGVREGVVTAVLLTLVEIGGLALTIAAGVDHLPEIPSQAAAMFPASAGDWSAVAAGAFIAFFAFVGFESMVNLAEETRDVHRNMPLGILLAIAISTFFYIAVVVVAIVSVPMEELRGSNAPLMLVVNAGFPSLDPKIFALIAVIAAFNGILIEVMVSARLIYGMAHRGWLPTFLAAVHPRTRIPLNATLVVGGAVLLMVIGISFEILVTMASAIILAVFTAVNLGLMRLHRQEPRTDLPIRAPRWVPPLGAATCLLLMGAALWDALH